MSTRQNFSAAKNDRKYSIYTSDPSRASQEPWSRVKNPQECRLMTTFDIKNSASQVVPSGRASRSATLSILFRATKQQVQEAHPPSPQAWLSVQGLSIVKTLAKTNLKAGNPT
ncbi:hypothetical protein DdX_19159 [Ditylenchus destructor]|uniref:Uncharacterized protein n=1 Tax=Ditylenchus destructor TaxID=166010 RepID=A0AAD4MN53_9BILA|nr:hypothetical protein DdX_19159 [Ditylenchus destructor]